MHSCFLVELSDRYLLFDYFDKNVVSDMVQFSGCLPELDPDKYLYVFASHSHKDHWCMENLRWADTRDNIKYILSKDIRLGKNYLIRNGFDLSIKNKVLFVRVDSDALRSELGYSKSLLIKNLNGMVGKEMVREIVLS